MEATNDDLIRAMEQVARADTPASRQVMYQALLTSQLLIPVSEVTAPGEPLQALLVSPGNDHVRPGQAAVTDHDKQALPAFTDPSAVARWPDNEPWDYPQRTGKEVFAHAREIKAASVLINPFSAVAISVGSRTIQILANGTVPSGHEQDVKQIGITEGTLTCIGSAPLAPDLVVRLTERLLAQPHVRRAFLFEGWSGTSARVCIGVQFGRVAGEAAAAEIESAMRSIVGALPARVGDETVEAIVLEGSLLTSVQKQVSPFFSQGLIASGILKAALRHFW